MQELRAEGTAEAAGTPTPTPTDRPARSPRGRLLVTSQSLPWCSRGGLPAGRGKRGPGAAGQRPGGNRARGGPWGGAGRGGSAAGSSGCRSRAPASTGIREEGLGRGQSAGRRFLPPDSLRRGLHCAGAAAGWEEASPRARPCGHFLLKAAGEFVGLQNLYTFYICYTSLKIKRNVELPCLFGSVDRA